MRPVFERGVQADTFSSGKRVETMISKKMKDMVANGSAIRAMFEAGKEMAAEVGAENVYDFSLGNPNTPAPEAVKEAAIRLLKEEDPVYLHGYMSNSGYEDVRDRLADSINQRFGTSYTRKNLIMTVGAAGALNTALKTILNPGDEVILQAPYFGEYNNYISNFEGVYKVAAPNEEDFSLNISGIEALIGPKTKALILNSPNNPTGVIYSADTIRRLCDMLREKEKEYQTTIYLISDEPYREIVYGGQTVPYLPNFYDDTFVGYSYSKSLSLPGERIGYLVINTAMEGFEEVVAAAAVANRILGYVNAPSLFQRVVGACTNVEGDFSIYRRNREVLYQELTGMGYQMVEPQGAFYMFPKAPGGDERVFCEAAKEEHILIVPGYTFAGPGYFRLAFCVSERVVDRSLEGFRRLAVKFGLKG